MWLVCAALPLQGVAATAMALCAPGHASTDATMTHDAPSAVHDQGAADGSHHHGSPDPVSGVDAHDQDSSKTCSVCASCCVGAGPLSHAPLVEFGQPPDTFAHPLGAHRAAYLTGGLERPPRPFLA
jgi:hypothetical protein